MFMPESAYGPTNQCIGLGKVLLDRGHRVVFAAEASWAGRLEPFGFVEALVDLAEPDPEAGEEAAGQFWIDFINQTAPEFARPTRDQLATFVQPTYAALVDGARYAEPRLRELIAEHRPDVIVEDNVVSFPALMTSDAAFVRIVSCNPLEVRGDDVPPVFSGYPTADRSGWTDFLDEFDRVHVDTWAQWNAWCQEQGTPPLPPREFMHASPSCNLYVFPRELDYTDARPLDDTWYRIDSSVRETDEDYTVPPELADRPDGSGLLYLSLGSLGGADVGLMQRLVDVLARSHHRVIVSMGPRADELRLPDGMAGAGARPPPKGIPQGGLRHPHGRDHTTPPANRLRQPLGLAAPFL